MLSNLVFVLLFICCCNCQTFNQNDGKWNPNPEERTNSFGSQSNVKPVTSRDRPYTYEAIQGSNTNNPNSNSNFKPLAFPPTNKVAQVTDVNASENNFPKAPETLTKTTVATPGQWISNNVPKTTKAPVNELQRVPVNNNIRPVNFGNNNQQINPQTSVNNNNQQNTVAKPTSIPVNTAIRSTISPSLTSNTGLNNQQRQPINSKPTYDVTTSDPKIFFPEEDKNLNRKPISHVCLISSL